MAKQTVKFMNGVSKSFAQGLLNKLFKGQSKFSILPFATTKQESGEYEGGIVWAGLSFNGADEIFTIKDSFSMTKADDTTEKIQIDQKGGTTIDQQITERGEWTFEGNIPTVCTEYCSIFYDKGAAIVHDSEGSITGQDGTEYVGQAFFMESKEVEGVVLIENANVDLALAFARVKMVVSPVFQSGSPAYLKLKGTILANTEKSGTQGDWATVSKYEA